MKKISILFIASIAFISLFSVSCDKDFETVNTDPNNPTSVPAHLLLGNIIRVNQNTIYDMLQGGDMGMCWAQHLSKVQYNEEERYIPRRGVIDNIWDTLFASVIADSQAMYTLAGKEGNSNLKGISLILQANAFQILTDLYGPIPFTEFNKSGNFKPVYDSQEVVYDGILNLLTQADAILASGSGIIPPTSDLVYGGDTSKWRKLANSLKFKALMRISSKRNVNAQLQELVNGGQLMSSNSDSAQLKYLDAQPHANPIYETIVYGVRGEYKVSSVLVDKLTELGDPRLDVYAALNEDDEYVGNDPGQENPGSYNAFSSLGSFYTKPTLEGVILSYAQLQFLLAEAANEGYISGGLSAALTYYKEGITANFQFNGIGAQAAVYIVKPEIAFSTKAEASVKIGEQEWLALYGQGFEAWSEWRRTGYPALSPVIEAAETSIPSRLYYNSQEVSLNRANYEAASATIIGGDKLTSPIWWMN